MSACITVYCHQPIAHLSAQDISKGLELVDWHTMGELYGVETDEIVELALSYFRIDGGNGNFTLHFCPSEHRQIRISIVSGEAVPEYVDECIGELEAGYDCVIQHLRNVTEIVEIETGYFQFSEIASVFMYAVAKWIADIGNGWIYSEDSKWWKVDNYHLTEVVSMEPEV